MHKTKLPLKREIIRNLTNVTLGKVIGGIVTAQDQPATNGNNECYSEATGCHTIAPQCNVYTRACVTTGTIVGTG
jgi:hypothetical protein